METWPIGTAMPRGHGKPSGAAAVVHSVRPARYTGNTNLKRRRDYFRARASRFAGFAAEGGGAFRFHFARRAASTGSEVRWGLAASSA